MKPVVLQRLEEVGMLDCSVLESITMCESWAGVSIFQIFRLPFDDSAALKNIAID